jgi:hypothetical protein
MPDELPLLPDVPDPLREAAQIGKLIPFVGAGASKLAGCPDWRKFADQCLQCFVDQGKFSYAQLALTSSLHPRIRLSIALALRDEHKLEIPFADILHSVPRATHSNGRRLYSALAKLGNTFVTTNYDEWLDEDLAPPSPTLTELASPAVLPKPRTIYHKVSDLTAAHLNEPGTVLHLHGSLKDPAGMILTTPQYVSHYSNDRRTGSDPIENPVLTFLDDLFRNKVVLFVGYGLEELEILEYVMVKSAGLTVSGAEPRHFLLQGFFSHEVVLMRSLRMYYRQCGVILIPFLKDSRDYDQLIEVLEKFATTIPASEPMIAQELLEMERLLDDQS